MTRNLYRPTSTIYSEVTVGDDQCEKLKPSVIGMGLIETIRES